MVMKIVPYKAASASAKALAEGLSVQRLKAQGSRYKGREGDVVINWGSSRPELFQGLDEAVKVLNVWHSVQHATNKIASLELFYMWNVPHPPFHEYKDDAVLLFEGGKKVVCRTVLNGHSGQGIVIANTPDELVDAPLYVQYIPKAHEYRVHVLDGEAFFCQRKARNFDVANEGVNWQVRNLAGGFIYANIDVVPLPGVVEAAVAAVQALGLDFGAADVVVKANGEVYVLEVNTACGLSGTTLTKYVEAFSKYK